MMGGRQVLKISAPRLLMNTYQMTPLSARSSQWTVPLKLSLFTVNRFKFVFTHQRGTFHTISCDTKPCTTDPLTSHINRYMTEDVDEEIEKDEEDKEKEDKDEEDKDEEDEDEGDRNDEDRDDEDEDEDGDNFNLVIEDEEGHHDGQNHHGYEL
jgi:hypothetical protein